MYRNLFTGDLVLDDREVKCDFYNLIYGRPNFVERKKLLKEYKETLSELESLGLKFGQMDLLDVESEEELFEDRVHGPPLDEVIEFNFYNFRTTLKHYVTHKGNWSKIETECNADDQFMGIVGSKYDLRTFFEDSSI